MRQTSETEKFLRAAVKAGLRMQHRAVSSGSASDAQQSEVVVTVQKIKASLKKRNLRDVK